MYTLSKAALFNRSRLGECQQFSFEIALPSQVETRYNVVISGCSVHSDHFEIEPTIEPELWQFSRIEKKSQIDFKIITDSDITREEQKIAQETQL